MATELLRWAHQGGAREGPSNTLAAMEDAINGRGRANALEFDVHRARGGAVVVIHDRTLQRTTNGKGRVCFRTLKQLRQLDAAYWWVKGKVVDHDAKKEEYEDRGKAPSDREYGVPTLDEVLGRFSDLPLTIEVKAWRAARPLVDHLAELGRRDVTVTSFFDPIVWRMRRRARRYPQWEHTLAPGLIYTLWFVARLRVGWPPASARYGRMQVPCRKIGVNFARRSFVDAVHSAGMKIDFWTIDDADHMRGLRRIGADGIMTDLPSVLADVTDAR